MIVRDVSLGFPVNRTIHCSLGENKEYPHISKLEFNDNESVKLVIHTNETERRKWKDKDILNVIGIKARLTFDIEKTTNVRAKSIMKARSNREKLEEYLAVNNISGTDTMFKNLDWIESRLEVKYTAPCKSFTLLKMYLKGSIGIKQGTGKDEIEVDFRNYPNGIIALTGRSGSGKSTLIENAQPYPRMLTRTGKLQQHFFMKDSERRLLYVDGDGVLYEISMLIDGKTQAGKVKYFVRTGKSEDSLEAIGECDGNADPYEKWVEKTFGSIELFLRTCFFAKESTKGIPDISEATKGEKKEFFASLLGLDELSVISNASKDILKGFTSDRKIAEGKLSGEDCDLEIERLEEIKNNHESDIEKYRKNLEKKKKSHNQALKMLAESRQNAFDENEYDRLVSESRILKSKIDKALIMEESLEEARKVIKVNEALKKAELSLDAKCKAMDKWIGMISDIESKIEDAEHEIEDIKDEMDCLDFSENSKIREGTPCPTCGVPLTGDHLKKYIRKLGSEEKEYYSLKSKKEKISEKIKILKSKISDIKKDDKYKKAKSDLTKATNARDKISGNLSELKMSYKEAVKMEGAVESLNTKDISKLYDSIKKRISELEKKRDEIDLNTVSELEKKVSLLERDISNLEIDIGEAITEISKCDASLHYFRQIRERDAVIRKQIEEMDIQIDAFTILAKAFGKDGIQALELEAAAPEIAMITNNILHSTYGDKYRVSFETLRIGSAGNLIEDFSIMVSDTETGLTRPLEWVSSGESVWIKEALYNAFTVLRTRSTGFSLRTKFLDESDGSLDSIARNRYLDMIRASHEESGLEHTVIITHSQELKDIIDQQIRLTEIN